jgi:HK97 gp10 family phage protein
MKPSPAFRAVLTVSKSIQHNVDVNGKQASVGTDIEYAKYLEFGTSKMPARPFLGSALSAKEHEIDEAIVAEIGKIFK